MVFVVVWCDGVCVDLWLCECASLCVCVCQPDTGGPPPKVLVH